MEYYIAIGIDVSDRTSKICVMSKVAGTRRIIDETTVATSKDGFREYLERQDRNAPVTFETGIHCRWMAEFIRSMGFKVDVANPAKLKMLTESDTKNDLNDARELARYTLADVEMLHPIFLRAEQYQQMIRLLEARRALLGAHTKLINEMRGFAKSMGFRIPRRDADYFHLIDRVTWPRDLETLCWPMLAVVKTISLKIKAVEKRMHVLADTPEFRESAERLQQITGVGFFSSEAFIAFLGGNYGRFAKARDVGPYLGLVPRQDASGNIDKQLSITKKGSSLLRSLLTECAQAAMREHEKMSDLRIKGLRIAARGGKNAKKRAGIAIVRSLAVTMVALLKHPEREYKPISEENQRMLDRLEAERQSIAA